VRDLGGLQGQGQDDTLAGGGKLAAHSRCCPILGHIQRANRKSPWYTYLRAGLDSLEVCKRLLEHFSISPQQYQIGRTRCVAVAEDAG